MASSDPEKGEQVRVQLVSVGVGDAVGGLGIIDTL